MSEDKRKCKSYFRILQIYAVSENFLWNANDSCEPHVCCM